MSASPTGPGHLVQRALAREPDRHQRVVDAPDGAEQADEGRGRADGSQHGQAGFQARGVLVDHAAHRAREELGARAGFGELGGARALVMARSADGVPGEVREGVVGVLALDVLFHRGERRRVPEGLQEARALAPLQEDGDRLGGDQVPGGDRHHQHDGEDRLAEGVGLGEEAGKAGGLLRVHGCQPSSRKEIGISTQAGTGSAPRLAGTNFQRRTVSRAASSSRA